MSVIAMNALIKNLFIGLKPTCLLCKHDTCMAEKNICHACWQTMPWLSDSIVGTLGDHQVQAACHYGWPVDRLIHLYKYQGRLDLLPILTDLMLHLPKPAVQAIVAVPLSDSRLRQRGFNQTLLLAKQLSKHWQIPIWQPLERHHTVAQQHLSHTERLINLQQAFYINHAHCRLIPRNVIVIDDVFTTGSTLSMIQAQLLGLGVQYVEHRVIAQAGL